MSLMKLLSVSRSFVSGKNESGRYRMAEQGVLPKFAPADRPASLAPKKNVEEPVARGNGAVPQANNGSFVSELPLPAVSLATAQEATQVGVEVGVGTADEAAAEAVSKPAAPICVHAVPRATNWFRSRKSPFAAGSAEASRSGPPVQTELSLDAVKPVRNDLSDADLEVVRAKPGANEPGAPSASPPGRFKSGGAGFSWSRLTARLFHSERVRT